MRVEHLECLERLKCLGKDMNYGMPYMGSKNRIAESIIGVLPSAEHFYDLLGGGGAIAHCAVLSGKYKHVHYNELNPVVFKGFKMAVTGGFKDEDRWISREDFNALKDTDPYVAICFSFGNCLKRYMYNQDREPVKKAIHYAICFNDYSLLDQYLGDFKVRLAESDLYKRRIELQRYLTKLYRNDKDVKGKFAVSIDSSDGVCNTSTNMERLDRIKDLSNLYTSVDTSGGYIRKVSENVERLERVQFKGNLTCTNLSYDRVPLEPDSVIYCDPPYKNTEQYTQEFNHDDFYEWCRKQSNIYISEYTAPDDFKCILEIEKRVKFSSYGANRASEKLFTLKDNPCYKEVTQTEHEEW